MADVLWWLQVIGGVFSLLLMGGGLLAGLYSTVRDAPKFIRRMTGVSKIEQQMDRLHADTITTQELQRQQAEAFNELADVVCEEHDISSKERPDPMNTAKIRRELLDDDAPNFRGHEHLRRGSSRSED